MPTTIKRFDEVAGLMGYFSATESVINKTGNNVDSVVPVYGDDAVNLNNSSENLDGQPQHDGVTAIGTGNLLTFYNGDGANNSGSFLYTPNPAIALTDAFTFVVVEQREANNAGLITLRGERAPLSSSEEFALTRSGNNYSCRFNNGTGSSVHAIVANTATILIWRYDGTVPNSGNLRKNGVQDNSWTHDAQTQAVDRISIMGSRTGSEMEGHVALVAMYRSYVSDADCINIEELCQYWLDNGEGPPVAPTSGSFGPVSTNKDSEVDANNGWQWEESADGTNWANVGTIISDISGATTNTLTVNSATVAMHDTHVRCKADTGSQIAYSATAKLLIAGET